MVQIHNLGGKKGACLGYIPALLPLCPRTNKNLQLETKLIAHQGAVLCHKSQRHIAQYSMGRDDGYD